MRLCYDCCGRLNDAERDLQAVAEPAAVDLTIFLLLTGACRR